MSRVSLLLALGIAATPAWAQPAPAAPAPASAPAPDPIGEKAAAIREAANLLEKAKAALANGNRNFAEQLFSSAELLVGPEALAELANHFRQGAPPRITTPLRQLPKDTPPQPAIVGNSDEETPEEPKPKRGSLSGTLALEGHAFDGRGVVMLEPIGVKWKKRAPRQRTMEQRNREFAPKILMVPVGSTVSFPNFDGVYHNVFARSEAKAFDLGIYKGGQSRDVTFDKEGIIRLGCNLHANMAGYIVVVSAPHYAITDAKGGFFFKSLEPGKYRLRAWSEKTQQPVVKDIVIAADKNSVALTLPFDATPGVDKFGVARGK